MIKAQPNNRLVTSPAYQKIMLQYNTILQDMGKVNNKKFYEQIVSKEIPNYTMQAWYNFLKRFKTDSGIVPTEVVSPDALGQSLNPSDETPRILLSNKEATARLIQGALHISAEATMDLIENPQLLTTKERLEIGLKAMKAQDSRIHAIGKVREDNREEEKLSRAFSNDAYAE